MRAIDGAETIGIDLNDGYLTAAQFRRRRNGRRVRALFSVPLATAGTAPAAGGADPALLEALRAVRRSGLFCGRRVVFNLPLPELSFFPVHFPFSPSEEHEAGIVRAAAKFLSFPAEEAIIDYPSLFQQDGTCHATVVAARRRVVDGWIELFSLAGFSAEVIDFYIDSIIRLHLSLFPADGRADILCHLGRGATMLAVVTAEGILSIAEIPWGFQTIRELVDGGLSLPAGGPEAPALLAAHGLRHIERGGSGESEPDAAGDDEGGNIARALYQIIAPTVNGLAYECHNTIGYVRSLFGNARFGTLYLYGLAGRIAHLDRYLEEQVELPVRQVALCNHFELDDGPLRLPADLHSAVPALGLALREVRWL